MLRKSMYLIKKQSRQSQTSLENEIRGIPTPGSLFSFISHHNMPGEYRDGRKAGGQPQGDFSLVHWRGPVVK